MGGWGGGRMGRSITEAECLGQLRQSCNSPPTINVRCCCFCLLSAGTPRRFDLCVCVGGGGGEGECVCVCVCVRVRARRACERV